MAHTSNNRISLRIPQNEDANKNHWQNKGQDGENLQKTDGKQSACVRAQSTKMHEAMRPSLIFLIQEFHENHIPFLFQFSQMYLLPLVKFLVLMARSMKTACPLSVLQALIYKREFFKTHANICVSSQLKHWYSCIITHDFSTTTLFTISGIKYNATGILLIF